MLHLRTFYLFKTSFLVLDRLAESCILGLLLPFYIISELALGKGADPLNHLQSY